MRHPLAGRHRRALGHEFDPGPPSLGFQTTAELHSHLMETRREAGHCTMVALLGLVLLILASIVAQL